jgi:hypothetical protein
MNITFGLQFNGIDADSTNVTAINFSVIGTDGTHETVVNGSLPVSGLAYDGLSREDALDYLNANIGDALDEMQLRAAEWIKGQYADTPKSRELPWVVSDEKGAKADAPTAVAVKKSIEDRIKAGDFKAVGAAREVL